MNSLFLRDTSPEPLIRSREDAFAIANDFLETRGESYKFAFVAGSFATGRQTAHSDIDIYVVGTDIRAAVREQAMHDGLPVQAVYMDVANAFGLLNTARLNGDPFYVHAFAHSAFLGGDAAAYAMLQAMARDALAKGPLESSPARIEQARLTVANLFMKLARTTDGRESAFLSWRLVQAVIRLMQLKEGKWLDTAHFLLRSGAGELYFDPMLRGLAAAAQGDATVLIREVKELLAADGGDVWATRTGGVVPIVIR